MYDLIKTIVADSVPPTVRPDPGAITITIIIIITMKLYIFTIITIITITIITITIIIITINIITITIIRTVQACEHGQFSKAQSGTVSSS